MNQARDILRKISLRQQSGDGGDHEWRPRVFDLSNEVHGNALDEVLTQDTRIVAFDAMREQLAGLVDVRDPSVKRSGSDQARAIEEMTGGVPLEFYGRWVLYPWSHRLVHVLPEDEFRELRTSTNRNKISAEEQGKLSRAAIGIVGLSSGAAIAVTLALEGIGGHFVLADFDRLELSNMNRLNIGVHDLGLNKAVLAARCMYEINPFCQIEIVPDGLTLENVDSILTRSRFGKLDLIFEQCDDLYAKFLLRERAQSGRVCVLMHTSDRGVLDVERFDLQPERPAFHGLTGDVRATDLRNMTTYEKIPTVLRILDVDSLSERMAASLIDIETTLKSWPQLASEVALGAAVSTDVARRILLGQMTKSERFRVDVADLICDARAQEPGPSESSARASVALEPGRERLPELRRVRGTPCEDDVRAIVAYAATAPSGGNCQPWRFSYAPGVLRILLDAARGESFLDYRSHASHLALGAATENASLAAYAMGIACTVHVRPDPTRADLVCELRLPSANESPSPYDPLVAEIPARHTNRSLTMRVALPQEDGANLSAAAQARGASLTLLDSDESLHALAAILGRIEMIRMLSPVMHGEMMREVRWTREQVLATRDGLDLATLELSAGDLAALRMISSWPIMRAVGAIGGGRGLARPVRKALERSSAVGLLRMPRADTFSFFEGGRALERVWLTASSLGWSLQPMTTITYLFDRLSGGGEGLTAAQRTELEALRLQYDAIFGVGSGEGQMLLFRLHKAGAPAARALRRPVDDILQFESR